MTSPVHRAFLLLLVLVTTRCGHAVTVQDAAPIAPDRIEPVDVLGDDALGDADTARDDAATTDAPVSDAMDAAHDATVNCTGAQPTSVGGDVFGYPDNRSINAAIGVELLAGDVPVDELGRPCAGSNDRCIGDSNYAFMATINPTLDATGAPESTPGLTRSWSRCVARAVTRMYYEGYPRGPSGHTDTRRYGETMSNAMVVTPGATVRYAMRFPLRSDVDPTGDTGSVDGWARCNGSPVAVTRINAWSRTPNGGCGVHAYQSGGDIGHANGYWSIGPMAAGQCGALSQSVGVVLRALCGGADHTKTVDVDIVRGRTVGAVNVDFP